MTCFILIKEHLGSSLHNSMLDLCLLRKVALAFTTSAWILIDNKLLDLE